MSVSASGSCPFCEIVPERVIDNNAHALAVSDAFPVAPGHTLILLRRHVPSLFQLSSEEIVAMHELLGRVRQHLAATLQPDGFNIGVNDGAAAGQTILHLHIHLIPRFAGDVAEPRGGIRNVIPGKGPYG
jgi:diadenosine tetraphosphate (Ap4A) HIT family hydrolase